MIKDFSKFKRLFVFGCSYTQYKWPTWAHILRTEIDNCEFYNFAKTGAGNHFISIRVAEANSRYKFNENDLVCIMWTSFTREDRWIDGKWLSPGSIYNQSTYPASWVKEFADPDFYLIRDYASIELTKGYLNNLPCTSFMMSGWPIDLVENNSFTDAFSKNILEKTQEVYHDTLADIPLDLRSWQVQQYNINSNNPNFYMHGHTYIDANRNMFKDGHPNTQVYREYLQFVGFPLTDKSKSYADRSMRLLKKCKSENDFEPYFSADCHESTIPDINRIF
jgi:hypothetical protein